ncbi:MAG: hypothetical protein OSJ60_20095 [Lachnospiraceae bacterium]|nr:hypothetical protein [Lachnospiraceae bacterium]
MDNTKQRTNELCVRLDEFFGYWYKNEPVDNNRAKVVLMDVTAEIKAFPVTEGKCEMFSVAFLELLSEIYFSLAEMRYADACNKISKYLCYYPIDGRRAKNALISVFKKFGF